ncbi:hypothetical protein BDZ97DRAFT_1925107 [Flammula alnicola]|nr:hypothetical protein BDZ97DRAFT_1925107 [Flammula alnicola]
MSTSRTAINLRTELSWQHHPIGFFVDGRQADGQLDLTVARGYLQNRSMLPDFNRANQSMSGDGTQVMAAAHPIQPSRNVGDVNNYVLDPTSADF